MPEIVHDAPMTEIYAWTKAGTRHRVYRGDTAEHIAWKMNKYKDRKIEVIVVGDGTVPATPAEPEDISGEFDDGDPRDNGLAGV